MVSGQARRVRQAHATISTIARWKILDNLRRSLVEPVTFLLFVLGWFVLPGGALYWTIAGLVLLLLPVFVQLAFNLGRALFKLSFVGAREGITTFASSFGFTILNLTFLLTMFPARRDHSLVELLAACLRKTSPEWETAAQVETGRSQLADVYLNSRPSPRWLSRSPRFHQHLVARRSRSNFLVVGCRTACNLAQLASRQQEAHYASDASSSGNRPPHLAILHEFGREKSLAHPRQRRKGMLQIRVSTNLGMFFNARLPTSSAFHVPEFALATRTSTLTTASKQRGHLQWYDGDPPARPSRSAPTLPTSPPRSTPCTPAPPILSGFC